MNDKIWVYDFEIFSKQKPSWWCVTFIEYYTDEIITIINDKNKLKEFYNNNKLCKYVGYNSRLFDSVILKGILLGKDAGKLNDDLISGKKPYKVLGRDLKKYKLYDYDVILKDKSLKQLEGFMGSDIRETTVPFDKKEPLTEEEINEIIYYNVHDVKETKKVLSQLWSDFEGQQDIIDLYGVDMDNFTKTKVQLASTILNAINQHTLNDEFDIRLPNTIDISDKYQFICEWYLNPKNWRYKEFLHSDDQQHPNQLKCLVAGIPHVFGWGGCHGCDDKQTIFEGILLHCDVSSMYPTTDIEYNLLSRKLKNPDDFRKMRDFRLDMKAKKNPKNNALKPMINGVYGACKDRNNPMYDPLMANLTCIFGQMIILDVIDKIEPYSKLVQTNTDGIVVLCDNEEMKNKVIEEVNKAGKRLKMEFEIDEFKKFIQKDVNNYIAVPLNPKDKIECKGAMVKYNKLIDNDVPILNDALREYFINNTPIEDTINSCNELIKFQKIIKLSSLFKDVTYGTLVNSSEIKDGEILDGKVHRLFASTRETDRGIYKSKMDNKQKTYEKISNTPTKCFIYNDSMFDKNNNPLPIPDYLDKEYYINVAKDRIEMFMTKEVDTIDNSPNILYECMCKSNNFIEFITNANENGFTKKLLEKYIISNCCNIYGKTRKLLKFIEYYNIFYNKSEFTINNINKKISDDNVIKFVKNNSELSSTGKKYINVDFNNILNCIFEYLEDKDIGISTILRQQIQLFDEPRYIDVNYSGYYYILSYRNQITPNAILYNIGTGEITYRKFDKLAFDILPFQDADVIKIINTSINYEQNIIGKDDEGVNILEDDLTRPYDLITCYEIINRDYSTKIEYSLNEG